MTAALLEGPRAARPAAAKAPSFRKPPGLRIVGALIVRDFDYRFRESPWIGAFQLLEPIALIAVFTALRFYIFGRHPPYGPSLVLFYATGVAPLYVFLGCSRGVGSLRFAGSEFRAVGDGHILAARFAIELIKGVLTTIVIFAGLALYGTPDALPFAVERCAGALAVMAALAFGVGCVNTAIASYFSLWMNVYLFASRALIVLSGVLYVADFLPLRAREWVAWNPLTHAFVLFRSGFYPAYPAAIYDGFFMLASTAIALAVGGLLYANRRRA